MVPAVTLYRLSGLAVLIGMTCPVRARPPRVRSCLERSIGACSYGGCAV